MTSFLQQVDAHTKDVKKAYLQGFFDAAKSFGYDHPYELSAVSYDKWVKECKNG